jgi:hypothetical protein
LSPHRPRASERKSQKRGRRGIRTGTSLHGCRIAPIEMPGIARTRANFDFSVLLSQTLRKTAPHQTPVTQSLIIFHPFEYLDAVARPFPRIFDQHGPFFVKLPTCHTMYEISKFQRHSSRYRSSPNTVDIMAISANT